jgi:hypothetical protein
MPYKEFLYVWMISLTAGTHFLSLITNTLFLSFFLSGRVKMAFLLLTVASTCD